MNLTTLLHRRNALIGAIARIREVEACLSVELTNADRELTEAIAEASKPEAAK
jgi:hypothetical protein